MSLFGRLIDLLGLGHLRGGCRLSLGLGHAQHGLDLGEEVHHAVRTGLGFSLGLSLCLRCALTFRA